MQYYHLLLLLLFLFLSNYTFHKIYRLYSALFLFSLPFVFIIVYFYLLFLLEYAKLVILILPFFFLFILLNLHVTRIYEFFLCIFLCVLRALYFWSLSMLHQKYIFIFFFLIIQKLCFYILLTKKKTLVHVSIVQK